MSVSFDIRDFEPCDLAWITAFDQADGSGAYAINWQPNIRGGNLEWLAWSVTTDAGNNGTISIQFAGDTIIQNMGFTDGVIYSPANMPAVSPNMNIVATGQTGVAILVYLNVLVRRNSS